MKTLVVGCDASGKSTMLEAIQEEWGDSASETTRSEEARAFRRENHHRVIDAEYIDLRESLYLRLSHQALLSSNFTYNSVTTGSSLVTRLSHSTMRQVINEPHLSTAQVIDAWLEDETYAGVQQPDILILTHAPTDIIIGRMRERQSTDTLEHFWGFNAPLFLDAYQERWKEVVQELACTTLSCLSLDTGSTTTESNLLHYNNLRSSLTSRKASYSEVL